MTQIIERANKDFASSFIVRRTMKIDLSEQVVDRLTPREKISKGIDPKTNKCLSLEEWHLKLIMMTATEEEFAPYHAAVRQNNL